MLMIVTSTSFGHLQSITEVILLEVNKKTLLGVRLMTNDPKSVTSNKMVNNLIFPFSIR